MIFVRFCLYLRWLLSIRELHGLNLIPIPAAYLGLLRSCGDPIGSVMTRHERCHVAKTTAGMR